jgi:hypothetical protein
MGHINQKHPFEAKQFPIIASGKFSAKNSSDSARLTNKSGPIAHIGKRKAQTMLGDA